MPTYQEKISVPAQPASQILHLAYGCFEALDWETHYVYEKSLVGCREKGSLSGEIIMVDVEDGELTLTSEFPDKGKQSFQKRHDSNVQTFKEQMVEFRTVSSSVKDLWGLRIEELKLDTEQRVLEEMQEQALLGPALQKKRSYHLVSYSLVLINVLVYTFMIFRGVSPTNPSLLDLINWGANWEPRTLDGQLWRLFTCLFIHAGIIHLFMNMIALLAAGLYLEPLLGWLRYLAIYICTGLISSLTSLWWHGSSVISVGASGAIFGLYGLFLAILTTRLLSKRTRTAFFLSIGFFVLINLTYGATLPGVDHAAHIGGLLSGIVFGYMVYFTLRRRQLAVV